MWCNRWKLLTKYGIWANPFIIVIFSSLISYSSNYLSNHLFILSHWLCYSSSDLNFLFLLLLHSSLLLCSYSVPCTFSLLINSSFSHYLSLLPGQFLSSIPLLYVMSISLLPNAIWHPRSIIQPPISLCWADLRTRKHHWRALSLAQWWWIAL